MSESFPILLILFSVSLAIVFIVFYLVCKKEKYRKTQVEISEERFRNEKQEAVAKAVSFITHELNNHIHAFVGYNELMQEEIPKESTALEYCNGIFETAENSRAFLKEISDFYKVSIGTTGLINLQESLQDAAKEVAKTEPSFSLLINKIDMRPFFIQGNYSMLTAAFKEIFWNCVDAGGQPPRVEVTIQQKKSRMKGENTIQILIKDNGPGIPEEIASKIFDPFFTTRHKSKHKGLGLTRVNNYISLHGGKIDLIRNGGHGALFRILLSAQGLSGTPKKAERILDRKQGEKSTVILYAEDNNSARKLLSGYLKRAGYTVIEANNGDTAYELAHQHISEINLLFLDVIMAGKAMNDIIIDVKKINPDIKIILCSGYPREYIKSLITDFDKIRFIQKPFSVENALSVIEEELKRQS